MQIEITTDEQPLSRTVWTFYARAAWSPTIDIKLEHCRTWTRPSTRHRKWTLTHTWPALNDRYAASQVVTMPERPTVPAEVEAELRKRIAEAIRFEWSTT